MTAAARDSISGPPSSTPRYSAVAQDDDALSRDPEVAWEAEALPGDPPQTQPPRMPGPPSRLALPALSATTNTPLLATGRSKKPKLARAKSAKELIKHDSFSLVRKIGRGIFDFVVNMGTLYTGFAQIGYDLGDVGITLPKQVYLSLLALGLGGSVLQTAIVHARFGCKLTTAEATDLANKKLSLSFVKAACLINNFASGVSGPTLIYRLATKNPMSPLWLIIIGSYAATYAVFIASPNSEAIMASLSSQLVHIPPASREAYVAANLSPRSVTSDSPSSRRKKLQRQLARRFSDDLLRETAYNEALTKNESQPIAAQSATANTSWWQRIAYTIASYQSSISRKAGRWPTIIIGAGASGGFLGDILQEVFSNANLPNFLDLYLALGVAAVAISCALYSRQAHHDTSNKVLTFIFYLPFLCSYFLALIRIYQGAQFAKETTSGDPALWYDGGALVVAGATTALMQRKMAKLKTTLQGSSRSLPTDDPPTLASPPTPPISASLYGSTQRETLRDVETGDSAAETDAPAYQVLSGSG